MDYEQALHEAYCAQQGLSPEEDCNLDHDRMRLLHETERVWVVLYATREGAWLNVVEKAAENGRREMRTIEL